MNKKLKNEELNRLSNDDFKSVMKNPVVIVLDNIRSLHNVGSVFRTSDAFLIEKVCLCGITAKPPHREIRKTALGATETVDWQHYESTSEAIEELKNNGFKIASIEQAENSTSLENVEYKTDDKIAFVFGNEVKGVDQEVIDNSDLCIEIPQFGTKHSLNISVSVGMIIWDWFSKTNG